MGTRPNQHDLSDAGFNVMPRLKGLFRRGFRAQAAERYTLEGLGLPAVMLRLVRSIHWVTMPFFTVDSCGSPRVGQPQNDTLEGLQCGLFRCGLPAGKSWVKFSALWRSMLTCKQSSPFRRWRKLSYLLSGAFLVSFI